MADWYGADRFDFRLGLLRRIGPDPDPDPDPRDLRFLAIMSSRDISNPVDILKLPPDRRFLFGQRRQKRIIKRDRKEEEKNLPHIYIYKIRQIIGFTIYIHLLNRKLKKKYTFVKS